MNANIECLLNRLDIGITIQPKHVSSQRLRKMNIHTARELLGEIIEVNAFMYSPEVVADAKKIVNNNTLYVSPNSGDINFKAKYFQMIVYLAAFVSNSVKKQPVNYEGRTYYVMDDAPVESKSLVYKPVLYADNGIVESIHMVCLQTGEFRQFSTDEGHVKSRVGVLSVWGP